MKRIICAYASANKAVWIAAVVLAACSAQGALIGHWSFDDGSGSTALDSASGNDATWMGGAGANVWTNGIIGGATRHNDEDAGGNGQEHFSTPVIGQLAGATQLTMSIWFNLNSGENNNSVYNGLFMSRSVLPGNNWGLALVDNGAPRKLDARVGGAGLVSPDDLPGTSGWHHALMTWDGDTKAYKIYVDGELGGSAVEDKTLGVIDSADDFRIGDDACCGSREFTGTLDDAAIWDQAMNAGQVALLYQAGTNGTSAGDVDIDLNIVQQPQDAGAILGDPASTSTWTVAVVGWDPIFYQWRQGGTPLAGETNSTLALVAADVDDYDVVVSNPTGTVTSDTATVVQALPPINEGDQTLPVGSLVTFSITLPVGPAYTYQWKKDGDVIPSATSAGYTIASIDYDDAGDYTVEVTLGSDFAQSDPATLTVTPGIDEGLIGHWPFDEASGTTAADATAAGNDALFQEAGGLGLFWTNGIIDGAAGLGGVNNSSMHFDVAEITQMDGATSVTWAGWFYSAGQDYASQRYKGLMMTRDLLDNTSTNATHYQNYGFAHENPGFLGPNVDGRVSGAAVDSAAASIEDGTWYHAALVWDGPSGTFELYVNGASVDSGSTGATNITDSGSWQFGTDITNGSRHFAGGLDDFAIWNRALTAGEIALIHGAGLAGAGIGNMPGAGDPPLIAQDPQDVEHILGDPVAVTFTVSAVGASLQYQWRQNGLALAGEHLSSLVIEPPRVADLGGYDVIVSNPNGAVTSSVASLSFILPPVQPAVQTLLEGATTAVFIDMPDASSYTYQWYLDDADLAGEVSDTYNILSATDADEGDYTVEVTWDGLTLESDPGAVTVLTEADGSLAAIGGNETSEVEDTQNIQWAFTGNFGGRYEIETRSSGSGQIGASAIRFTGLTDLAGEVDTITAAILRVKVREYYNTEAGARTMTVECRQISSNNYGWVEGTQNGGTSPDGCSYARLNQPLDIGWVNYAGTGGAHFNGNALEQTALGTIDWDLVPPGEDVTIDIPLSGDLSFIMDWINGGPNAGLALYNSDPDVSGVDRRLTFYSSEAFGLGDPDAVGPQLILVYTPLIVKPVITAVAGLDEGLPLELHWLSLSNEIYDVQAGIDLVGGNDWTNIATGLLSTPPTNTWADGYIPAAGAENYRVVAREPEPVFFDDFEMGLNGWSANVNPSSNWELGTPNLSNGRVMLTNAYSAANCWGTDLDLDTIDNTVYTLRSPTIDLTGLTSASLEFAQFLDAEGPVDPEPFGDWGQVNILNPADLDGTPLVERLDGRRFHGSSSLWDLEELTLPAEALNREIVLEFEFKSDVFEAWGGWYIDDVKIQ